MVHHNINSSSVIKNSDSLVGIERMTNSWVNSCVVLIIVIFYTTSAANNNKATTTKQKNTTVAPVQNVVSSTTSKPLFQGVRLPCSCAEGQCGCCTGYILDRFNQKACMNVTYEPDEFALSAAMSMNGKVVYKNTVSGKNPPPVCVRVPRLQFIRFCVHFSNIYVARRNLHVCMDAEANWEDITLIEWSFDCVRMGASGVAVVGPEEGGGIPANPIDAVDQTDEDYDDSARDVPLKINNNHVVTTWNNNNNNHDQVEIIFGDNIRNAARRKPDKRLIQIRKLNKNKYLLDYNVEE